MKKGLKIAVVMIAICFALIPITQTIATNSNVVTSEKTVRMICSVNGKATFKQVPVSIQENILEHWFSLKEDFMIVAVVSDNG